MLLPRPAALTACVLCLLALTAGCLRAASLLQLALDDDRLNFSTGGTVPGAAWTAHYDAGQCVDLLDGMQAPALAEAGEAWISATVYGPATLDFMWALEGTAEHRLTCSVDGVAAASCEAAPVARWAYVSVEIPPGARTVRWTYRQAGGLPGKALLDRVGRPEDAGAGLTCSPWIQAVLGEPVDYPLTTRRPALGWVLYSGSLPPGLSLDSATGQVTGIPQEAGVWRAACTIYAPGSVLYYSLGFEVSDVPSLPGSLDNAALEFTSTASDNNRSIWQPQRDGGRDGGDCLAAGLPPPLQRSAPFTPGWSAVQTTVTGPDVLSYWVRVADGRVLLLLNDREFRSHSRLHTLSGWQRAWLTIPAGTHTVRWKYESRPGTAGAAWLDDVRLRSQGRAFITQQPDIAPLPEGGFHFTVPAANASAGWAVQGLPAGLTFNAATGTISGAPQRRGVWRLNFSLQDPAGERDEVTAVLDAAIPPAEATDLPDSWWRADKKTGAKWFGQNEITHDGTDAMRTTPLPPDSSVSLTTMLEGPGILRWWWHLPSGTAGDTCSLALDGKNPLAAISATTPWKQETVAIPAGLYQVAWRFRSDAEGDPAAECAVVDQVSFVK